MSSNTSHPPSTTTSLPPSTTASTQSLTPRTERMTSAPRTKPSDRIPSNNCCASFFYNIPRASIMVTLPGFAILAIGAILVATFPDRSNIQWTDGLQLISFIFLILGGAWTLGGILFWIGAWCRYRPRGAQKKKAAAMGPNWGRNEMDTGAGNGGALELVRVCAVDENGTMTYNQTMGSNRDTGGTVGGTTGGTGGGTTNGTVFTVY